MAQKKNDKNSLEEIKEELKELRSDLEQVEEERKEYLQGWQRARADLENYKKETEERIAQSRKWAKADFVQSLLPVLDSFRKALEHSNMEGEDNEAWGDGFESVYEQIISILEKQGVEVIEPEKGDEFDPEIHEAVSAEDGGENEHVTECLQTGYQLDERVIRPARVKVGDNNDAHR